MRILHQIKFLLVRSYNMYTIGYNLQGNPNGIFREEDGAWIPLDSANSDYQRYLRWLENPEAEQSTPSIPKGGK